ncbi:MAG TPA: hypothetical protein VHQ87_14650 [Rhizobacter sp.]|jgi:hypothetical protein|nr:hypothetical protein [Rhizobacter sp.]
MPYSRLYRSLSQRWWLAFVLLGVSFVVFGLASLNLIHILSANLEFLSTYGWDAVREGALWQLAGLVVNGVVAAACYIAFKLCEKVLVERLAVSKNKGSDS